MEQEEYRREEINWSYIDFVDNQDVLDLIEKVWTDFSVNFILLVTNHIPLDIKAKILFYFAETNWNNLTPWWSMVRIISTLLRFPSSQNSLVFFLSFWYHLFLVLKCSMLPKSTHGTFTTKLFQNFQSHKRLQKNKFSQADFTLSHYAGKACDLSLTWN